MTERELRTIVDVSHEEGVIEESEKDMLNNVFDFKESLAKDIMIPRIDVTFVSVDASYDEVLDIFREAGYSRLPVYEGSKDHVVGIVYFKDVYFYRSQHRGEIFHLKDVLRKPFFTYETQKVSSLLAQMREKSVSFSIVLDEYGVTAGLITLEDIVEEIFGELRDEYDDSEEETFKKLSDGSYMVSASLKLDDLDDLLDVDLDSEDYDSLGGYIIELLIICLQRAKLQKMNIFFLKLFLLIRTVWKQFISFQKSSKKKNLASSCKVLFLYSYLKYSTPDSKIF